MSTLLFVDDDQDILQINAKYFSNKSYEVHTANTLKACLSLINSNLKFDCIILDVMMPDMDGFTLGQKIRQKNNTPIIFLSGKTTVEDKIKGFSLGAEDYLTKPYSLAELEARIMVQVRRGAPQPDETVIVHPPLSINYLEHKAYYNDEEIHLTNREYELLYLFFTNPNEVIDYEMIGNHMWGYYSDADKRTIMVTVSRLRKKLDNFPNVTNMFESVWSKGYKFIPRSEKL